MLPDQKTKIVATIGPASESPVIMEAMIKAGMNIARINLAILLIGNGIEQVIF